MRTVLERLLDYTAFDTQSDETTGTHPSTAKPVSYTHLTLPTT